MLDWHRNTPAIIATGHRKSSTSNGATLRKINGIMCVIDPTTGDQPAMRRSAWLARNVGAELALFVCYYSEYLNGNLLIVRPDWFQTLIEMANDEAA